MIGEVAAKATAEIVKGATKEVGKNVGKEIAKEVGKGAKKNIDVRKRIDVTKKTSEVNTKEIDISKRIRPNETGVVDKATELTAKQENDLIDKGMSPGIIKDCKYEDGIYKIKTQNEKLVNNKHPETGVPYVRKIIDIMGNRIDGVFPKFDSVFTTHLPPELYKASDSTQFGFCNQKLQEAVQKDPKLKKKFNKEQLEQIQNGDKPRGYIWHHNEELGRMELVKADTHDKTKHSGGKCIWGGGRS